MDRGAVDKITSMIAQQQSDCISVLQTLESLCIQDSQQETPFNTAIIYKNRSVIDWFLQPENQAALNFAPAIDDGMRSPVNCSIDPELDPTKLQRTEQYLTKCFSTNMCWQRTPLLTACRYGDAETISGLLTAGVQTDSIDILGFNAVDLCKGSGNTALIRLLGAEASAPISKKALKAAIKDPQEYNALIQQSTLTPEAWQFAFCTACATVDQASAEQLLKQGGKINEGLSTELNPLLNAAFSSLLAEIRHPEAALFFSGQPQQASVHVDNDAIAEVQSMEELEALFRQSSKPLKVKKSVLPKPAKRIQFIKWLVGQGLDVEQCIKLAQREDYVGDLAYSGSLELLETFLSLGFTLPIDRHNIEQSRDLRIALQKGNNAVAFALTQFGHPINELAKSWQNNLANQLESWREKHPDQVERIKQITSQYQGQAISQKKLKSKLTAGIQTLEGPTWELAGESMLLIELPQGAPKADQSFEIHLIHSNGYGPDDQTEFLIRVANPTQPTNLDQASKHSDWIRSEKTHETLLTDEQGEVERSQVTEPIYDEIPWTGRFTASATLPAGKHCLEIWVRSEDSYMNFLLNDWFIEVGN